MTNAKSTTGSPQGFLASVNERIPLPPADRMNDAQRAAADAIIAGPRKAIFGPFVALLQCPALMDRIGATGEALRYQGQLPDTVRELVILAVARETSNQFEWQMHAPLAKRAGVSQDIIDAVAEGRRPHLQDRAVSAAFEFACELMQRHGVSDVTYRQAEEALGRPGVVELTSLIGYFTMVCWIMNVARTPGPAGAADPPLSAFPA